MLEYHRILKLDVISQIIQFSQRRQNYFDFLKYNILAFFLLSMSFTHRTNFSHLYPTLYTVNIFIITPINFSFPHLFKNVFPNSAQFISFFSFTQPTTSSGYLSCLNYNILEAIKDQVLFFVVLSGPSTVPDLVMLNYC